MDFGTKSINTIPTPLFFRSGYTNTQFLNCPCGMYFHLEKYPGVVPFPPFLVAYAPKITPVNPQLTASFDATMIVRNSDCRPAGPTEKE